MKLLLTPLLFLLALNGVYARAHASDNDNIHANVAAQRLVVLSPHLVEMLYEIGAGDNIIATVEYADYPQAAKQIPRIGRHDFIDLETLILMNPDAVILSSRWTSQLLMSRLQQLGFKLVDIQVTQLDDIPKKLIELGELTGHISQASTAAQAFTDKLTSLKRQYQHLAPIDVLYQIWPMPLTTSATPWLNEILIGCGGRNVFADSISPYPQISTEQVLSVMPEVIIKPVHGNKEQVKDEWHNWPELPAVANGQIVSIDGDLVHRTGPRVLDGMAVVCRTINSARQQKLQRDHVQKTAGNKS